MAEYIEREVSIERIKKMSSMIGFENPAVAIDCVIRCLENTPASDAVLVVRCKDCKHGEVDDPDFPDQYYCREGHMWNSGCHFCADGKQKD